MEFFSGLHCSVHWKVSRELSCEGYGQTRDGSETKTKGRVLTLESSGEDGAICYHTVAASI